LGISADVHERRQAIGGVNFDFDNSSFEADDGAGIDFGKHAAKCTQGGGDEQIVIAHPGALHPGRNGAEVARRGPILVNRVIAVVPYGIL